MSLIRRNTGLMPSLWDEVLAPDWFGGIQKPLRNLPAVNIREEESQFILELAIPGQKKEDFNIEVDQDVLTISMESGEKKEETVKQYTRREFHYTSFKRAFTLPESVNQEDIRADYREGILRFSLPKKQEALPTKKRLIAIGG
ncbi:Hsp20/alpha crystallin family protein [Robiginitalea marina]|uniref:Hsp20/alpha crystallin family protein n=1 Tax=Robiginitalea marina TaxID=2954105 RepID=A0ABT1AWG0_9FLAO|nr:Hsp20/alpha crystallin family protein [Robiginitalea marina]MCO5724034.1 Hsp20/alpha crystallin family protein [Robiginitalea marina]